MTPAVLAEVRKLLEPLGDLKTLIFKSKTAGDSETDYVYLARFEEGDFRFSFGLDAVHKLISIQIGQ